MDPAQRWRVIDTGLRAPEQNAALDRALLEAREAEEIPSTLRFLRYTPAVLLGALQDCDPLIDAEACRGRALSVHRRLADGGAFVCDGPHLAWTLYLSKADVQWADGRALLKRLCHAAAAGISALGMDARYRARNEIVVDGRVLAQAGALYSDEALMFQAVIALDGDPGARAMLFSLPWTGNDRVAALRRRYTTVHEQLARRPDAEALKRNLVEAYESEFAVELRDGELTLSEQARYEVAAREHGVGPAQGVMPRARLRSANAVQACAGGSLAACVVFDDARTIRHVWFAGCSVRPASAVYDLEAALRDVAVERVAAKVSGFFASRSVRCDGCVPGDFAAVVRRAVDQPLLAR